MTRRVFIAFVTAAALWLAAVRAADAAPVADLEQRVDKLERRLVTQRADKAELRKSHAVQTAEVASLKRRKSSWRRDRVLRSALARSQATSKRLAASDKEIRGLSGKLRKAQRNLLRGIETELKTKPAAARRAGLLRLRKRVARALKPRAKKIVLPSERIDPLADADELSEQSSLLVLTDKALQREEKLLAMREQRYTKMARLQRERARVDEADVFDDNRPRRTTSRQADNSSRGGGADFGGGSGAPAEADSDDAGPAGLDGGGDGIDPSFDSDPAVVLVDVVDDGTLDALRNAEGSNDPAVKAKAAKRAREQVRSRRERLERQRNKIEARIRALRNAK